MGEKKIGRCRKADCTAPPALGIGKKMRWGSHLNYWVSAKTKAVEDVFNHLFPFLGRWVGKDNKNRQPRTFRVGAVWRAKCILLMS